MRAAGLESLREPRDRLLLVALRNEVRLKKEALRE